jgi:UDP-2,3-diacylglucosamine pyrophosphatase LpxH
LDETQSKINAMNKTVFDAITKSGYGRERLSKEFGVGEVTAREWLAVAKYLQQNNMPFVDDPLYMPKAETIRHEISGDEWSFGVISDAHIGSSVFRLEELNTFVKYAQDHGVETFLLPGDLIDGARVYPGQEYEQNIPGIDAQIAKFEDCFPKIKKGYFIIGNHEYAAFKSVGKNVGLDICRNRKEFQYVGCMEGRVEINGVLIEMFHPTGSGAYALSYKLQKRIESYVPGDKPRILLMGHYHQSVNLTIRNVTGYLCGSWQGPNTFSKALNLPNVTGGWIIKVLSNNGQVKTIDSKFVQFY